MVNVDLVLPIREQQDPTRGGASSVKLVVKNIDIAARILILQQGVFS